VWQLSAGEEEAPKATDADRGWPEILLAAALQGAIFAVVMPRWTAALPRVPQTDGAWPGVGDT
jgi:hypothetical protein